MRLLLINPSRYDDKGRLQKFRYGTFPPLNLLLLAGMLKNNKHVQIKVVDEFIEEIPFDGSFDLAAVTTIFTSSFPRVIDICKSFRSRKIPVVLGGPHVTCSPEESRHYADALVLGEGEKIFPKLIDDFLTRKKLEPVYKNESFLDLSRRPAVYPDYSLIDLDKYFKIGFLKKSNYFALEASRGCPMNCTFCCVKIIHGQRQRYKKIGSIIEEIRFLKDKYNAYYFNFSDDNFFYDQNYYTELLREVTKEKIRFHCEISPTILKESNAISLLKEAGCASTFIGLETIDEHNLKSVKKGHNKIKYYKELIDRLTKNKIIACPAFIFGFDNDNSDTFLKVLDFLKKTKPARVHFSILTPLPGTKLHTDFVKENRIFNDDYSFYDAAHAVFQPRNFSPAELENKFWKLYQQFYSYKELFLRLIKGEQNLILLTATNLRAKKLVHKRLPTFSAGIKQISA